jgi:hypothetical protein
VTTALIEGELIEEGVVEVTHNPLAALNSSEIDMQIATAHRFPRSVVQFQKDAVELATLDEQTALECMYALPRAGKNIEGPSVRMAEIVMSCWGNCRAGARIIGEDEKFVVAQGFFFDLQRNAATSYEVRRRITDKNNKRFNDDMIVVTSNAACSIAIRNAVFRGVPKAIWNKVYQAARKTAIGDIKTLAAKRHETVGALVKMGATEAAIFAVLGVEGMGDIGLDDLAVLRGAFSAIQQGETTVERAFEMPSGTTGSKVRKSELENRLTGAAKPAAEPKADPKPVVETQAVETEGDDTGPTAEEMMASDRGEPTTKGPAKQASMLDDSEGTYGSGH